MISSWQDAHSDAEPLRRLLDGAVEHAIIETSLDRRVRVWSAGAARLFGWSAHETVGQSADVIFTPEDQEAGVPESEARLACRDGCVEDARWHVRRDGSRLWASGVTTLLRDAGGAPDGLVKIMRDQTTSRAADEALLRALDLATRSDAARSRLMAVAGHDLRQPLQVIVIALDRLAPKLVGGQERRLLGYALEAAQALTLDLTALAEASVALDRTSTSAGSNRGGPSWGAFPVRQVLGRVSSTWRHHARIKGVRLRVMPCRPYRVRSDPAMLTTVLNNLVGNAIKYTNQGRVVVGCRRRGEGHIAIEVVDTGIGIPPRLQRLIFDPQFQADPASDGLGLGLSIVQRTLGVLGHELQVESEPGRGSRFGVVVPLA